MKRWPWWDMVLVVVIGILCFAVSFVPNGIPVGGPFLLAAAFALWCSKSLKAKAHEVDAQVKKLLEKNKIFLDDQTTATFDLSVGQVVLGKDYKWRSPRYVVCKFCFHPGGCDITVYCFDIVNETLQETHYVLPKEGDVAVGEATVCQLGKTKKTTFLVSSVWKDKPIAVDLNNAQCSKLVNKLLSKQIND